MSVAHNKAVFPDGEASVPSVQERITVLRLKLGATVCGHEATQEDPLVNPYALHPGPENLAYMQPDEVARETEGAQLLECLNQKDARPFEIPAGSIVSLPGASSWRDKASKDMKYVRIWQLVRDLCLLSRGSRRHTCNQTA